MSSTLSHKRHDFRGKKLLKIKCVSGLSLQFLSETSHSNGRIRQDTFVNVRKYTRNVPIILVNFNEI